MNRTIRVGRLLRSINCGLNAAKRRNVLRSPLQLVHFATPSPHLNTFCSQASSTLSPEMKSSLDAKVNADKVVVFMKGDPEDPKCGFSRAVCLVLKMHEIPFKSYDVLEDEQMRQAIKEFSNWPTIPQLYINGEFVGGCDIIVEMHQNKEIVDFFKTQGLKSKYDQ